MLLKLGCVVLVLVFLNEVHLVTPENTTTIAAATKPAETSITTKAGSDIATATSAKPAGGAEQSTSAGSNTTKTTNTGTVQHGSSMAIVLPLLTVTSLTMFIFWL